MGLVPDVQMKCILLIPITVSNCIPNFKRVYHVCIPRFKTVLRRSFRGPLQLFPRHDGAIIFEESLLT